MADESKPIRKNRLESKSDVSALSTVDSSYVGQQSGALPDLEKPVQEHTPVSGTVVHTVEVGMVQQFGVEIISDEHAFVALISEAAQGLHVMPEFRRRVAMLARSSPKEVREMAATMQRVVAAAIEEVASARL
ncbi:MAG: hypothetical protein KGL39_44610 [Patescibacteria group bacterium]|nr:hypothetical protein [Patescibacteria group bacterium]